MNVHSTAFSTLLAAVRDADPKSVLSILARGEAGSCEIQDALLEAIVLRARDRCFDALLPHANLVWVDPGTLMIPMMTAAFYGRARLAKHLFPSGGPRGATCRGRDALMISADRGHVDCCNLFVLHLDPTARGPHGATALMMAAAGGHADCVALLLAHSVVDAQDQAGMTALMWAAERHMASCVELLLPLSNVDLRRADGRSALALSRMETAEGALAPTQATLAIQADMERRDLALQL